MNTSILLKGRVLVLAVAAVFLAGSFTPSFQALERGAYAAATRVLPSADVSEPVAVVGIDRAALAGIGPWPWSRDRVAATIDRLRVLGARAVGVVLPLEHAETPPGLEALVEEARGSRRGLSGSLKKWAATLDTDRELARAMLAQGRVVIVAEFRPAAGAADASAPSAIWSMKVAEHGLLAALWGPPAARAVNVRGPLPALAGQAAAVGVITDPRADQSQVSMPLALRAGDRAVPGLVTALAALAGGASPGQWEVLPGKGVRIGKRVVVAPDLELRPLALPAAGESSRIAEFSVAELWQSGRIERALRGKTVLLGFTDASLTPLLDVPGRRDVAPVTWLAHGVGSLIEDSRIRMPAWFYAVQRLLVVALAALLLLVPPRWHGRGGAVLTLACAFLMLNAELVMLLIRQLWLPLGLPAAFLVVLQVVLWIRRAFAAWAGRRLDEVAAARRELGMSLKGQGRLDDAFTEYRRSPPRTAILEPLYELGLAYESRRQFAKAAAVYAYADCVRPAFRDVRDRLARLKKVQAGIPLAPVGGGGAGNRTVILNDSGIENPTLAHYRLERELGRGAMAVVYLATDEKLGRKVAVKALALTEEFEGEALEEAQARFRREAEAAARLNHPNIVTIYEAGEDHDLAYIAMDYVEGESLEDATDADDLLPVWDVLEIGIQVADALDYAHDKQVVHRDVKPSNIIYDTETGTVKVTDFGIACLTDSSRTRTGTVLGTPSYMSPEQAAGKKLDGRSDLFSLGVTLYQLLTGRLPFVGDSLANLIYRITTQKHPALKTIRPDLNASISRVMNKVLQKNPDDRYATGAELAEALTRCQEKVKRVVRKPRSSRTPA